MINRQTWRDPDKRETQTVKDTDRQAGTHGETQIYRRTHGERHRQTDRLKDRDKENQPKAKTQQGTVTETIIHGKERLRPT